MPFDFSGFVFSDNMKARQYDKEFVRRIKSTLRTIIDTHNEAATSVNEIVVLEFGIRSRNNILNAHVRGLTEFEAMRFKDYRAESFVTDNAQRFEGFARDAFDLVVKSNTHIYFGDIYVRDDGVYMDLE